MGKDNILQFAQGAEFYYDKFEKLADQGKYLDALVAIREAVRKEPDIPEYQLAMAELYTELCQFDESNFILFGLISKGFAMEGDCLFGIGCNFYGLQNLEKAEECFARYLRDYPGGEYEYDVQDFLDMMDEEEEAGQTCADEEIVTDAVFEQAERGKDYLDAGEYDKAIVILEKIAKENPRLVFIRNNLALAYFCEGKTAEAIRIAKEVLAEKPSNVHAVCNLILFYQAEENEQKTQQYRDRLAALTPADYDEKIKVVLTCCELGEHELAYTSLREVVAERPYDIRTMFLLAAAAANTGRLEESVRRFLEMLKLEPENTVALYYKNEVQKALERGEAAIPILYHYQVPLNEVRERMRYLNENVQLGMEEISRLWKNDERFRRTLLWGLSLADPTIKKAVVELLGGMDDPDANEVLRRFLLRRAEPDEIKNDIFMIFRRKKIAQPYVAYISGKIVEVRVGAIGAMEQGKMHPTHQSVLERMMRLGAEGQRKDVLLQAVVLFERYLKCFSKPPAMRNTEAWAGAFLVMAQKKLGIVMDSPSDMAKKAGAAEGSLRRCLRILEQVLMEDDDEADPD